VLKISPKTAAPIIEYRTKFGEIWEMEELSGLPGKNQKKSHS